MGSDCGNGPPRAGQVCDEKTNVCEPLLTHRKSKDGTETGAGPGPGIKARAFVDVPRAGELPVCGPGGVRCIGGVSSSQALAGKGRTCRLDAGDQSQLPGRLKGGPQAADTARGRVPMRGTGADRPAVVTKVL